MLSNSVATCQTLTDSASVNYHFFKQYENDNLELLDCSLRYSTKKNVKYYTIDSQSDLVLFKSFSKNMQLLELGYFRLVFEDKHYCWIPDLNWVFFDENNKIIKEKFYLKGKVINETNY